MLLEQLKDIVGPKGWTTSADELETRLRDWRGLVHGSSPIAVSPANTQEVAAVIRVCADAGVGIVPQGGNTGMCAGAIPDKSGTQIILSLARMNKIRQVDAANYSMEVEAGCVLQNIQNAAREADRYFALSLGAEGSCQIGGNLATNAGGINVIRYGTARAQVLGIEAVLADGTIVNGLRSLRKLEEIEIKTEHTKLSDEREALQKLIKSEARQWTLIKKQIGEIKEMFGPKTALGRRRTTIGRAPSPVAVDLNEAMIEKEPVSVICSSKGWIRAMKGHGHNPKDFKYKDGDRGKFVIETQTTDKLLVFGTNGRFYTLGCDKLPPGRGFGEPLRLTMDLPNDADIVDIILHNSNQKILVGSTDGRGFVVGSDDVLAQTKNGKQILNISGSVEARLCTFVAPEDDHIAVIGKNRKMLVFALEDVPEMTRGRGVMLQKYKDGGLSDAKTFNWKEGLMYKYASGETMVEDLNPWLGQRAQAGRLPPNGFPKSNRFG